MFGTYKTEAQQIMADLVQLVNYDGLYVDYAKWDSSVAVGRTFFVDRLKNDAPFNKRAIEKLLSMYRYALQAEGKQTPAVVATSETLTNYIKRHYAMDLSALKLYDQEKGIFELTAAKIECLLDVLSFILFRLQDRTTLDTSMFTTEFGNLINLMFKKLMAVSGGARYTHMLIQNAPPVPIKGTDLFKMPFSNFSQSGSLLFFFSSSVFDTDDLVYSLLPLLPDTFKPATEYYADLELVEELQEDIAFSIAYMSEEDMKPRSKNGSFIMLPDWQEQGTPQGYDKQEIETALEEGHHVIVYGSHKLYVRMAQHFENIVCFLPFPDRSDEIVASSLIHLSDVHRSKARILGARSILMDQSITNLFILPYDTSIINSNIIDSEQVFGSYIKIIEAAILSCRFKPNACIYPQSFLQLTNDIERKRKKYQDSDWEA